MIPLMLTVDAAAKALSIGKTKLYAELKEGRIAGCKLGKRTFIKREELERYLENLPRYESDV